MSGGSSNGDSRGLQAMGSASMMVSQADGTRLVVKNGFLQVVDEPRSLVHSHSDSALSSSMSSISRDDEGTSVRSIDAPREEERAAGPSHHLIFDSDNSSNPRGRNFMSAQNSIGTDDDSASAAGSGRSQDVYRPRSQRQARGGHRDTRQRHSEEAQEHHVAQAVPPYAVGEMALADLRTGGAEDAHGSWGPLADNAGSHQETPNAHGLGELAPSGQPYEWSRGSERHAEGKCKPCLYMATNSACTNGYDCRFCHLSHATKRRTRPSKSTRMQCRQLVETLETVYGQDESQVAQVASAMAADTNYMQSILKARSRQQGATNAQPGAGVSQSSGSMTAQGSGQVQRGGGGPAQHGYHNSFQQGPQHAQWANQARGQW